MKKLHRKIKSHLTRFRLFMGRLILDKAPSGEWHPNLLPKCKILFIRHDGKIGDFIVSSFVYREIKKQYPNIHIGVVVAPETHYLFKTDPNIDSLYITHKRALIPFWQTGRKIAKEHYDVVIDLTSFLRNRDLVLIRCVKALINIGYHQTNLKLFNHNVDANNEHITLDYEKALSYLGFKQMNRGCNFPNIPVSDDLRNFCDNKLTQEYIAINFFGAANHKKFSTTKQIELLEKLKNIYPDRILLVLTYPQVTEKLKQTLPINKYVMYEQTKDIFDSIELIRNASLVVSPDTSIVHIAAAFNKPMIAFYMNSDPANPWGKWLPMNDKNTAIYHYQDNINDININNICLSPL